MLSSQITDKQRIIVVGNTRSRIVQIILFVLEQSNRKADYSTPLLEKISDAEIVIIEPGNDSTNLEAYNHHALIISKLSHEENSVVLNLVSRTPKGGIILFDETDPLAKRVAKIDRVDATSEPYLTIKYEMVNGKIMLISSTNEKFQTLISSSEDVKNLGAAKAILRKIGVPSSQFYKAIRKFH